MNKVLYLDIDAMRQILTPDAFAVYVSDMVYSVYIVLTGAGTFHYQLCDTNTGDVEQVFYLTKELNNYYLRKGNGECVKIQT